MGRHAVRAAPRPAGPLRHSVKIPPGLTAGALRGRLLFQRCGELFPGLRGEREDCPAGVADEDAGRVLADLDALLGGAVRRRAHALSVPYRGAGCGQDARRRLLRLSRPLGQAAARRAASISLIAAMS